MYKCKNLAVLDLTGCPQVGNKAVMQVLINCTMLNTLILDDCRKVTDGAFSTKKAGLPLVGLLSLKELSLANNSQLTT